MSDDDEFSTENMLKAKQEKVAKDRATQLAAAQNDPELQAILTETRQVQTDTVLASRNAAKTIKETMVVGDKTNVMLKQQGEQLERIEGTAAEADTNATVSYEAARDLEKYSGLIPISFKNMFTGSKKKKQDADLEKTRHKLDKQQAKQDSAAEATTMTGSANAAAGKPKGAVSSANKKEYSDEYEREIDSNLDDISAGLGHLQATALDMNTELNRQNVTIAKIDATADHTDYTLNSANKKIQKYL